jgi:hypothetical protein
MAKIYRLVVAGALLSSSVAFAQDYQRRARIVGGDPFRGRCTVEVIVDGAAEVDLFGDGANLRDLAGQPAQWRRFECTAPMPRNPGGFRYGPVSGRGKQSLVRPAGDNGPAVVRIEDPQGGAGVYVFDIQWEGRGDGGRGDRDGDRDRGPRQEGPSPVARAISRCQERVQERLRQDGWARIEIRSIRVDDQPGRNDWVVGRAMAERREGPRELEFSCNVDLRDGDVRSVDVKPREFRR